MVDVNAEDIALRDIQNRESDMNQPQIEFSMFVQTNGGASLLSADALLHTIMVINDTVLLIYINLTSLSCYN